MKREEMLIIDCNGDSFTKFYSTFYHQIKEPFTAPKSDVSKVINGVGGATSGSDIAPYCSECPPATAGPASTGAVDGPSTKSTFDGYRMEVALNHLLWYNKKSNN
ncbi:MULTISPECIES: hypothetical protein [unclassified Chryseobacterium]|uniref:hypothetical protein n=1 Tax=unclassified Chryseobacterium TaxID=2593645 RepID=UPI001AE7A458|nr:MULTISPECIES: hypothetical protein [unclassified Chryseobacterium]MBP1164590.1 hypothetical protein [Chryseobacterium sp. PvR013]